jgi:hypothetical protein
MKIKWESSDKYLVGGLVTTTVAYYMPARNTTKETLMLAGLVGVVVGVAKSESIGDAIWFFLL